MNAERARRPDLLIALAVAGAALVYDPLVPAAEPKRVAVLLVSLAWLAWSLGSTLKSRKTTREPTVGIGGAAFLFFVAWSLVSTLWGKPAGLDVATAWAAGAGFVVAASTMPPERVMGITLRAGWWVGTVSAFVVLAQWAAGIRGIALHGGHGNGNWLGLVLAITLPLSAGTALEGKKQGAWWWAAAAVGTALQLPALLLANSRVAWIAALVAGLGVLRAGPTLGRRAPSNLAVLALAASLAWSASPAARADDASPQVDAQEALGGRSWIWRTSLDAAAENLPLGAGLGDFGHVFLEAQGERLAPMPVKEASRRFHNATTAHQDWIQALVDTGPLGLAALLVCVGAAWYGHVRRRRWPAAGACAAFALCAAGDSPLHQPAIVLLLSLLVASSPRRWRIGASVPRALSLVMTALLLALAVGGWLSARLETRARDAAPALRRSLLERAAALDGRDGQVWLSLGLDHLETGEPKEAVPLLERSRERLANVGTDIALGNAWMEAGQPRRAEPCYRRALALHPGSMRAHANLAEALRLQGKLDAAEHHLDLALQLYPGHPKLAEIRERLRRDRLHESSRGAGK